MALIIKCFKTALKGRKEYPNKNKTRGKRSCFKCGKTGHFIAQCLNNDNDQEQERHGKKEKKNNYRKAKGEAHLGKEWDSDCSSSDSDDEGLAASAFDKSSLFPNERHTCLMAKEKKVRTRDSPKYTSSSDEESSDDEVDYTDLFKGLDRNRVDKINELIDTCWGLVLKCYELRTRQHKMLNINALRPLKHYLPKDLMNFGRRP
jgi:hypothetical protein